ncbi:hypothetical protein NDU88_002377 [Pleurodeles waltl]|uniref:Uncharacterized protein n=1 Tax=Pleurodeles waltl TaxID=8319 RepID=A0AAV7T267_PLEWA|nr:hypothetical protein NDU88_002377 [Pleurodeles waltl]
MRLLCAREASRLVSGIIIKAINKTRPLMSGSLPDKALKRRRRRSRGSAPPHRGASIPRHNGPLYARGLGQTFRLIQYMFFTATFTAVRRKGYCAREHFAQNTLWRVLLRHGVQCQVVPQLRWEEEML